MEKREYIDFLVGAGALNYGHNNPKMKHWYKNHLEAVYCIGEEGEIVLAEDGTVYPIKAGTMYALDGHEKHYLRAWKDMRMICVFNPPCTGRETHGKEGAYPLLDDEEVESKKAEAR